MNAWIAVACLSLVPLAGCTSQQGYGAGQAWQQNQCKAIPDKVEYDRCMAKAGTSYETYRKQQEGK
jgi:hypothetical protein